MDWCFGCMGLDFDFDMDWGSGFDMDWGFDLEIDLDSDYFP